MAGICGGRQGRATGANLVWAGGSAGGIVAPDLYASDCGTGACVASVQGWMGLPDRRWADGVRTGHFVQSVGASGGVGRGWDGDAVYAADLAAGGGDETDEPAAVDGVLDKLGNCGGGVGAGRRPGTKDRRATLIVEGFSRTLAQRECQDFDGLASIPAHKFRV